MPTEQIQIVIVAKGVEIARRGIDGIGNSARAAGTGVKALGAALTGALGGFSLAKITQLVDGYTTMQNRLKLVTNSSQELAATTNSLDAIAGRTRNSMAATVDLYSKSVEPMKALGKSTEDALKFTEQFSKAATLSGSSAQSTAQGIYQFSQALGKGKLNGDELVTVMESLPYVADVLSKSLGVQRGQLSKLAEQGKLTGAVLVDAFLKSKTISADFAKTVPTVEQALGRLRDNFQKVLGAASDSSGFMAALARGILYVAENMDTLMPLLVGGTVAFSALAAAAVVAAGVNGLVSLTTALSAVVSGMARVTLAMLANPITAGVTLVAIGAAVIAWREYGDELFNLGKQADDAGNKLANALGPDALKTGKTDIKISVMAQDAASQLRGSLVEGGQKIADMTKSATAAASKPAAEELGNGVRRGAADGARALEEGLSRTASKIGAEIQAKQAARDKARELTEKDFLARYDALNGKHIRELGAKIGESGKVVINTATGQVTKMVGQLEQAGDTIKQNIETGGETAGQSMERSIAMAGMQAGQSMFQQLAGLGDVWSNSLQMTIGDLIDRQLRAQYNLMSAQQELLRAQAKEARANARAALNDNKRSMSSQLSTHASGSGGGFQTSYFMGRTKDFGDYRRRNSVIAPDRTGFYNGGSFMVGGTGMGRDQTPVSFMAQRGERVTVETERQQRGGGTAAPVVVPVRITNVSDPREALTLLDSPAGERIIVNHLRNNREMVRRLVS